MAPRWSPAEEAILKEIWTTPCLLKTAIVRLPLRNYDTCVQHAVKKLKLGPKVTVSDVMNRVVALMKDNRTRTINEIAALVHRSYAQVRRVLLDAVERKEFRIVRWSASSNGGELQAYFRIGRGKSAPRPVAMTASERGKRYRARVKSETREISLKRRAALQRLRTNPPRDELMDALYGRREYAQVAA